MGGKQKIEELMRILENIYEGTCSENVDILYQRIDWFNRSYRSKGDNAIEIMAHVYVCCKVKVASVWSAANDCSHQKPPGYAQVLTFDSHKNGPIGSSTHLSLLR